MAPEISQQLQASVPECAMYWTLWQAAPCDLLGTDHTGCDGSQTPHQNDRGLDPHCRLCRVLSDDPAPTEDYPHILAVCRATANTRSDKLPTLLNTVMQYSPCNSILDRPSPRLLAQFILDCLSLNLPLDARLPPDHPGFADMTRQCSIMINAIHKDRTRQLRALGLLG